MPWRINAEVKRIEKYLYHFAFNLVKQRRTAFEANQDLEMNDILSLLVKSNDFTNDELASQVLTMMVSRPLTKSGCTICNINRTSRLPSSPRARATKLHLQHYAGVPIFSASTPESDHSFEQRSARTCQVQVVDTQAQASLWLRLTPYPFSMPSATRLSASTPPSP